jgi:methionyl-tRNA formyltransferase
MVTGEPIRIVFFGTPEFAVPTLDALLQSKHLVVGVVTQPDRPRGRGQQTTESAVKARAAAAAVPVLQPLNLKDDSFLRQLRGLRPHVGVVAAYGRILPDAVLALPPLGLINVHASLLPRHRGAAPVHRAIIAGDSATGVTIMRVVKALDAGPMLAVASRPILPDETSVAVERDLARIGAQLLASTLEELRAGRVTETPQDDSAATYASRLTKDDGLVDWGLPGMRIHNLIRGLHPWPHAFTYLEGRRIILLKSTPLSGSYGGEPGTIVEATGDRLIVASGVGTVGLLEIQPEGKRAMTPREFLAGHPVARGSRLAQSG